MNDSLTYSGKRIYWKKGANLLASYRATSGLSPERLDSGRMTPDYRSARFQCEKDHGPIPQGTYHLELTVRHNHPFSHVASASECALSAGRGIERIPRGGSPAAAPGGADGAQAGRCETYWANWGRNRARLMPADAKTAHACGGSRSNFYVHDSSKGYSHGCIEVEAGFFTRLYSYARDHAGGRLKLTVKYSSESTYGGTDRP